MELTVPNAKLELAVLNAQATGYSQIDVVTQLTNQGLPLEGITRIQALWDETRVIGGQIFNIGKIIVIEILNFAKAHPNLAIGMAVGAAVGALGGLVPYLGPLLSPLTIFLGVSIGAVAGSQLDGGKSADGNIVAVGGELITIAKKFFSLIAAIFNALVNELSAS